jgi:hypothetical protein
MAKKPSPRGSGGVAGSPGFVAYYRVSTAKQGQCGLGLEAQGEGSEVGRSVQVQCNLVSWQPRESLAESKGIVSKVFLPRALPGYLSLGRDRL